MLGIAQSVLIFVFAKFSITFIGQIRNQYILYGQMGSYKIFFPLFAQLFDMFSYLIMKYFGISFRMNVGEKVKNSETEGLYGFVISHK